MKKIFDDEIDSFETAFGNSTKYNVDMEQNIVSYIGKVIFVFFIDFKFCSFFFQSENTKWPKSFFLAFLNIFLYC